MSVTVELPKDMEARLRDWARLANQSETEIVRRALESYLAVPPDLRDELEAWQQLGAEALGKVTPEVA